MATNAYRSVEELLEYHGKPRREVYLDHENSGLVFPEALEDMIRCYREVGYGHPSITHRVGWEAYEMLYKATRTISDFIGVSAEEIAYTHSGTEANNLAVFGAAKANKSDRKKIVMSSIEHLSVIFPAEELQKLGYRLVKVEVDEEGLIDMDSLSKELDKDVFLVSVAAVNHEIGAVQDIRAIAELVKDKAPEAIFHTDVVDALGRVKLRLGEWGVDLASLSSHKVYGPKGAGALYIRDGLELKPILLGQLSTQRLWPGVENVPAIVGFAKAIEIVRSRFDDYVSKMRRLRDKLIDGVLGMVSDSILNGPKGDRRSPDNVNVSFLYCEGEALTVELSMRGVYVSSGSACTSRILEPSHVLLAIGRRYEEAHGSILMKVTPMHDEEDINYALEQIPEAVDRVRGISPVKPRGGA